MTTNYIEAGNRHPDTQQFDDTVNIGQVSTITGIKGFFSNMNVIGLQVYYEGGKTAGQRTGWDSTGQVIQHVTLNPGETIMEISGNYSNVVHRLCFVTDQGRNIQFGTNMNGTPFVLSINGMGVKDLKMGIGGHLHYIGATFVQKMGMQQQYVQPMMNQPYVQPMMNQPYVQPMSQPYQPMNQPCVQPMIQPLVQPMMQPMLGQSNTAGQSHADTQIFNDALNIQTFIMLGKMVHIRRMKVFHDHQFVFGFEVDYDIYDDLGFFKHHKQFKEIHKGLQMPMFHQTKEHSFAHHEFITAVTGRGGVVVDHLRIFTNKGCVIDVGGPGGNEFALNVPMGRKIYAFAGGLGGHLHNISAFYY